MTSRSLITVVFVALCGAALWGILAQGRQVSELRAEQKRLESARPATDASHAEIIATPIPTPDVPRELLQLRAEVARLSQQQRELSAARQENQKLRQQLENRRTNHAAKHLGSSYIRTSDAKWVGYNTPEDTLQSLFWAAKNRNVEKFLEGLTPETVDDLKNQIGKSDNPTAAIESLLENAVDLPPVFEIVGREQLPDGSIGLRVQIVRGNADDSRAVDTPEPLGFKQIGGQWKLSKPH
jgi:hypothetical protein